MRSNIDRTRRTLESLAEIDDVQVDGTSEEVILRAYTEQFDVDLEELIDGLDEDVEMARPPKNVGFGLEVELI